MAFDSLAAFAAMGGYGGFVWTVYAITTVVFASLALAPLRRNRRFWLEQSMRIKRERLAGSDSSAAPDSKQLDQVGS